MAGWGQCGVTRKRLYRTEALASEAAVKKQEKHGHGAYPYCCGFCGFWHLSSSPSRRRKPKLVEGSL